ncbi:MAG: DUF1080 domain-containing protein [Phycisphaerae bacterium]|nr:DUF1080 domain-containing protein [Phycisphaerae bacterium]
MTKLRNRVLMLLAVGMLTVVISGCKCPFSGAAADKGMLFNGKNLDGWKLFIPDEKVDVNTVWSVKDGVVYCTGKPNGYMRTEKQYSNYRLHLEWRWPGAPTNSGVLLHAQMPDNVWPKCVEAQLQAGNAGDFIIMGHTALTVKGEDYQDDEKFFLKAPKWMASTEKKPGEWNSYDIICKDDTIQVRVNGALQNVGTKASITKGYICLQSEGGPIEFRNIKIKDLD